MKKIFVILLFLTICGACYADVTSQIADPSQIGVGARPLALGKAFAGNDGDASGMMLNPAGLADITTFKAMSMSGQLLSDYDYFVVGGAQPTDMGTFGFNYINVGLASIPITTVTSARHL